MKDAELLKLGEQRAMEIGLTTYPSGYFNSTARVVLAGDIHKLLGAGIGVKCASNGETLWSETSGPADHEALLIGIRPLAVESREAKLEKVIKDWLYVSTDGGHMYMTLKDLDAIRERARKLLAEKEVREL